MDDSSSPPNEVRFHQQRKASTAPLPFLSTPEHRALVQQAYEQSLRMGSRDGSANPYALLPDTLNFLRAMLEAISPKVVMEFGSGESTTVFASWLAQHGGDLISVEHDKGWVAEVQKRLPEEVKPRVRTIHQPLRLARRGLRQFLTYGSLLTLASEVARAELFLLDGPHNSGREPVLYLVLSNCRPGSVVVVDDFRHYAVVDMLRGIPPRLASCFAGEAVQENSHGLYVLRCLQAPVAVEVPSFGWRSIARSYWRSLRDFRENGTGD